MKRRAHVPEPKELKKAPNIKWTRIQRLALLLLVRRYEIHWADFKKVWQKVFFNELVTNGFFVSGDAQPEFTWIALQSQCDELIRYEKPEYVEIFVKTTWDELSVRFAGLNKRLIKAAKIIGVSLVPSTRDEQKYRKLNGAPLRSRTSRGQKALDMSDSDSDTIMFDLSSEEEIRQPRTKSLKRGRGKPPPQNRTPEQRPSIFFRTYSVLSGGANGPLGFRAGREPPPNFDAFSAAGIQHAANHFNRAKDAEGNFICTPYISITDSLIFAVSKAMILRRQDIETRICLIEGTKIASPIYRASELIASVVKAGLKRWQGPYKGANDFMVLGAINSNSIVSDFGFRAFQALAATNVSVGKFLRLEIFEHETRVSSIRRALLSNSPGDATVERAISSIVSWMAPGEQFEMGPLMAEFRSLLLQNWSVSELEHRSNRKELRHLLEPHTGLITPMPTAAKRKHDASMDEIWLYSPYETGLGDNGESPCAKKSKRMTQDV